MGILYIEILAQDDDWELHKTNTEKNERPEKAKEETEEIKPNEESIQDFIDKRHNKQLYKETPDLS